jgi:hypothetical protein
LLIKPISSWRKASVAPIGLLPPAGSTEDKINRPFIKVNAVALENQFRRWIRGIGYDRILKFLNGG